LDSPVDLLCGIESDLDAGRLDSVIAAEKEYQAGLARPL
jgi:hypothetical protein